LRTKGEKGEKRIFMVFCTRTENFDEVRGVPGFLRAVCLDVHDNMILVESSEVR